MRMAPLAALVLGAVCLTGCDDDFDNLVILPSTTGTFTLTSANGAALPATIVDSVTPPLRVEVLSGHLILRADGTFEDAVEFRNTIGGVESIDTVVCRGTYFVSSTTITFNEDDVGDCGESFIGLLNGNTISATLRGVAYVFIR